MLILYLKQGRRLHSFTGRKGDSKETGDKSYLTLLLIHSSTEMTRPKDVHVLTLIERLFVPNILKKKKVKNKSSLKSITFVRLPTSEHALAFD